MVFLQNTKVGQMVIAPPQEDACDGREEAREEGEEAGGISGEEERWDELPPGYNTCFFHFRIRSVFFAFPFAFENGI